MLVGLGFFHAPILQATAQWLVVRDGPTASGAADYVVVWNGDQAGESAVALLHAGRAMRVLLVEAEPRRVMQLGIVPTWTQEQRLLLNRYGIPDDMIELLTGDLHGDWREERILAQWMEGRKETELIILCDELRSRRLRYIIDQLLEEPDAQRIRIEPLADRQLDLDVWWKGRIGWKEVFAAWFEYGYARSFGPDAYVVRPLSPQEYESDLESRWFGP